MPTSQKMTIRTMARMMPPYHKHRQSHPDQVHLVAEAEEVFFPAQSDDRGDHQRFVHPLLKMIQAKRYQMPHPNAEEASEEEIEDGGQTENLAYRGNSLHLSTTTGTPWKSLRMKSCCLTFQRARRK
jgi:hypothetical protein